MTLPDEPTAESLTDAIHRFATGGPIPPPPRIVTSDAVPPGTALFGNLNAAKIAGHINASDQWLNNFVAIRAEDFTPPSDAKIVEWMTAMLEHLEQTPDPATRRALQYAGCRKDYDRVVRKLRRALGDRLVKQHLAARRIDELDEIADSYDSNTTDADRDTPSSG